MPELYSRYGRMARGSGRKGSKGRQLARLLPNHIELHPPNAESQARRSLQAGASPEAS